MTDFDLQQQLIAQRRQQYAGQREFRAPQGQMVGRHFVAPNALQYLAEGLRSFGGMRGQELAEKELTELSGQRQKAVVESLRGFSDKAQGRPADDLAEGLAGPVRPAMAPDMQGAFASLLEAPDAGLRQAGMQGMVTQAQQTADQARKAQEQARLLGILQSTSNAQEAIAAGVPSEMVKNFYESPNFGRAKVDFKDAGGQFVPVTEYGDRPAGVAPIERTGNPFSDMLVRGPDGQLTPNMPLVGAKATVAAAGKPVTTVDARTFNTQENEQSKVYGRLIGEQRGAIMTAGIEAPRRLAQMERMEQLLTGIEGGRLAPAMADVASALNSVGISIDPKLGPKEAAEALAIEMALKMRPPGSGPMTDRDFENFLRTAPSLAKSAEGRREIIQTVRSAVQRDLEAAEFARQYAEQNNGVIDDKFFQELQRFYVQNPVVTPALPATNSRGAPFKQPGAQAAPAVPPDISQILQMYSTPGAR